MPGGPRVRLDGSGPLGTPSGNRPADVGGFRSKPAVDRHHRRPLPGKFNRGGGILREALDAATLSAGDELIAVELHQALEHLGRILGSVYTDDILDRIFSKFCIGK